MHQVGLFRRAVIGPRDSNAGLSPENRFDAIRVFCTGAEGVWSPFYASSRPPPPSPRHEAFTVNPVARRREGAESGG